MIGFNFLFIILSFMTLLGSVLVISARNPVKAVLSLVFTFISASGLWLMMQAEFLALVLVVVYVGAVMVLFLFVVMMLNVDQEYSEKKYMGFWFLGFIGAVILFALLYYTVGLHSFGLNQVPMQELHKSGYSNVAVLADMLFSNFVYPIFNG